MYKDPEDQGADAQRKTFGFKKGIRIESRKIHTVCLAAVELLEISRLSLQRMLRKDIKAFPYNLQTVHKLEEEDNDCSVEMCETLLNHYKNKSSMLDNI